MAKKTEYDAWTGLPLPPKPTKPVVRPEYAETLRNYCVSALGSAAPRRLGDAGFDKVLAAFRRVYGAPRRNLPFVPCHTEEDETVFVCVDKYGVARYLAPDAFGAVAAKKVRPNRRRVTSIALIHEPSDDEQEVLDCARVQGCSVAPVRYVAL